MHCQHCGHENPHEQNFCGQCGEPLGPERDSAPRFSPREYTPPHLAERILGLRSVLEGERKHVTILFCDIVGSTSLAEKIGPEAMHRTLDRFFSLSLDVVHRYEGTVNQFLGDGFMALFGAPLAHEDHARRAVLSAFELRGVPSDPSFHKSAGSGLSVRIGINTGEVVVGKIGDNLRMDYTAIGDTVNVAARLQQICEARQILIGDRTRLAVAGQIECKFIGERQVKGRAVPTIVYEPLEKRPGKSARPGVDGQIFVGRERELSAFDQMIGRLSQGQGGLISISAEAGLGKSRLLAEFKRRTADRGLSWLEGNALLLGRTLSYWPFLQLIRSHLDFLEEDDDASSLNKLDLGVRALFGEEEMAEIMPYLATMLSLPIQERYQERIKYLDGLAVGHQIYRATRLFFERLAKSKPTILVFDDWHWADSSSIGLLEHLLPLQSSCALLFCVAARPESGKILDKLRTVAQQPGAEYVEFSLTPLNSHEAVAMLGNAKGLSGLSPRGHAILYERSGGNPFFMEELVKSLQETEAFVWDQTLGQLQISSTVEANSTLGTLDGLLQARIDRLGENAKHVLRRASVIGQSFLHGVLRGTVEKDVELDELLSHLVDKGFLTEVQKTPERQYVFRHALIQEASYRSILTEQRRSLHLQVACALEEIHKNRLDEFCPLIAYHYANAEDWQKAQEYLFKAGDQAGSIAADAEALGHYEKAIAVYDRHSMGQLDPRRRANLDNKIGDALFRLGRNEQAISHYDSALSLLGSPEPHSRSGVRTAILKQLLHQCRCYFVPVKPDPRFVNSPETQKATEVNLIRQALGWILFHIDDERALLICLKWFADSEAIDDTVHASVSGGYLGLIFDVIGLYGVGSYFHRKAGDLSRRNGHPGAIGHNCFCQSFYDYHVGQPADAMGNIQRARDAFRNMGHLRFWGGATAVLCFFAYFNGRPDAMDLAQELRRMGEESGDQHAYAWGTGFEAINFKRQGNLDAAIDGLQKSIVLLERVPDFRSLTWALIYLALCYLRANRPDLVEVLMERSMKLISERRITGIYATPAIMGCAQIWLELAEGASGEERAVFMKRAERACKAATKQSKRVVDDGVGDALRLNGNLAWLNGKESQAIDLWKQGIEAAQRLESRYALSRTHFEIGRRLRNREHLQTAERLFNESHAWEDSAMTRNVLAGLDQEISTGSRTPNAVK